MFTIFVLKFIQEMIVHKFHVDSLQKRELRFSAATQEEVVHAPSQHIQFVAAVLVPL